MDNNNIIIDNNNNYNNDILFFSIWRNLYILSEIQRHIRLYNENEIIKINQSMDQLRYHPHRRYATRIIISINEALEPHGQIIPFDIKSVFPPGVTNINYLNQEITPHTLPPSLANLTLGYNQDFAIGTFPKSLTFLNLISFNKTITPGSFSSIVKLILPSFDQPLKAGDLPISLEELTLFSFDQPLQPNVLPPQLKKLVVIFFNQPLSPGVFPESITDLTMDFFDHPLSNSLSKLHSLNTLNLKNFDEDISMETFPNSITNMSFDNFNQPLKPNVLPPSITKLILPNYYHHPLEPKEIPPNVQHLDLGSYNHKLGKNILPNTLKYLSICSNELSENDLPSSITKLNLKVCDPNTQLQIPSLSEIIKRMKKQ
ncbi:hypothetical protein DICPUDRAFT_146560 [Dictyostelium purpureum]|uniref:FNIP repeat-containing protein n=1 Tax=Dictyostelium purpureum TaxID=5786 RepID=F0Z6A2_DICPU|nr:uncharacterized protein DICPUDRAFT_146560 [Dictyostelium purpureum]EGC40567.1 hypothetical protein DICPUDRAFT_146560 [Dictyostelium purpureum]|eukprot:XP_003282903.1 hypothetical protein DICPUDRAFT_146560 [Dictyostelium purpureum]